MHSSNRDNLSRRQGRHARSLRIATAPKLTNARPLAVDGSGLGCPVGGRASRASPAMARLLEAALHGARRRRAVGLLRHRLASLERRRLRCGGSGFAARPIRPGLRSEPDAVPDDALGVPHDSDAARADSEPGLHFTSRRVTVDGRPIYFGDAAPFAGARSSVARAAVCPRPSTRHTDLSDTAGNGRAIPGNGRTATRIDRAARTASLAKHGDA